MSSKLIYLSLGSNIEPEKYLPLAVRRLAEQFSISACSSVWRSPAFGSEGPDFLNAVIAIEGDLDPFQLKVEVLRPLEASLGRVRTADKNAIRTIDIDILVIGDTVIDDAIWDMAHLTVPLAELLPNFCSQDEGITIAERADQLAGTIPIHKVEMTLN